MKPFSLTTHAHPFALIALIAIGHLRCTGQQPPNPADSTQVQSELVRPPRIYGAYTLQWDRYVGPFYRDTVIIDTVQYFLEEQAPGIVCWFREATMYPGFYYKKIEYYDTLSKTLLKSVDLEQLNPYLNGQHTPISLGNFDWDYMNLPEEPDSNCVFAKLPPSQYYSTYNDIRLLSDAGYYMVGNYLIGYYRDEGAAVHVVSWESTVTILNPQGEEVLRIKPDHTFYASLVTADGRYLCVSYGGRQNALEGNPFEPCAAYFDLYDMNDGKRLMHYLGMNQLQGITPGYMKAYANGMIYSYFEDYGDSNTGKRLFEQLIFDPYRGEVRIYNIGEDMSLHPQNNVNTSMETMPYKLRKF